MRWWAWPVLAFLLFILQGTGMGTFSGKLLFDLPLLFVYNFAMLRGPKEGLTSGLVLGLIQDLLSGQIFGFHALTHALCGYYCGSVKELVFRNNYPYHLAIMFFISLLVRLFFLVPLFVMNGSFTDLWAGYLLSSLSYCVGNSLLVVPLGMVMVLIERWIEAGDITY